MLCARIQPKASLYFVCMYVCSQVYICIRLQKYVYVYICVYMYVYVYACCIYTYFVWVHLDVCDVYFTGFCYIRLGIQSSFSFRQDGVLGYGYYLKTGLMPARELVWEARLTPVLVLERLLKHTNHTLGKLFVGNDYVYALLKRSYIVDL